MADAMVAARSLVVLGVCSLWSCGGGQSKETKPPAPAPAAPTGPTAPVTDNVAPIPHGAATTPATPADHAPELFAPGFTKVGVGQKVSFSVAAVDQDLDETRVIVTTMPPSATFDPITQTVTWTPTKADMPKAQFAIEISQPTRGAKTAQTWTIEVDAQKQPLPVAEPQRPLVETLLMITRPKRLEQVNKDWPLDKLLQVGADSFRLQIPEERRKTLTKQLTGKLAFEQFLTGLAQTQNNPRLDPKSPQFDKAAFGDPKAWKIVAFRPRIDRAWTELRVVYQAVKAPEPVFAMFRLRPVVEYVPALPRPEEEHVANNKIFLGMVAKHLMVDGGPNPAFATDEALHGKAVSALMTELMTFDDTKGKPTSKPYLHGFEIGIALEARMGGGSARNPDGSYKSGDGWAWSAQKPFQTADGTTQAYVNVVIPGFWTQTKPTANGKSWMPVCASRFNPEDPKHEPGYEVLCRRTMGLVDLPDTQDGKVKGAKIDANNLYLDHKLGFASANLALDDGRRDVGEENGMTCSQCHIRNFGMHDYADLANVDPSKGTPKTKNHALATLNFQIIPSASQHWEAFTLEFLQHQECRGKLQLTEYLGADAAKGLTCPLAK